MPTVVTKTIGSTGRNYATVALYEAYVDPLDFVSSDTQQTGLLYNDSEFSVAGNVATFNADNVDSTHYLVLRPATGQGFADNSGVRSNALFYNATNGVGLSNTATGGSTRVLEFDGYLYTQIIGLQLKNTDNSGALFTNANFSNSTVSNCIIYQIGGSACVTMSTADTGVVFNNCLFVAGSSAIRCFSNNGSGTITFNFCTFIGPSTTPYIYNPGTATYNNCAFFGAGSGSFNAGGGTDTFSHCVTDIPGATGLTGGKTFANQFVSTTTDFRTKTGADLINAGAPVGGITTDISGFTRNASTPTVGAWEFPSAAAHTGMLLFGGSLGWTPSLLGAAAAWRAGKAISRNATVTRRSLLTGRKPL